MARQLEINHQAARIHDRRDHRRRHDRRVEMDRLRRNRKHTSDRLRDDNRAEQADNYLLKSVKKELKQYLHPSFEMAEFFMWSQCK